MAFSRLMLTTDGKTLYAKAQQGKTLQFTRIGIGDGDIGSGSLVNRTTLISQKLSLLIDVIQLVDETESAIITTLKNENLAEGFYFREIGIFAKDPDTQQEKLYLYDNAGAHGEYIPDNQSGVIVNERLKFLLLLENVTTVSFVPSGNPIYLSMDDIDDTIFSEATLWSSAKTKAEIDAALTLTSDQDQVPIGSGPGKLLQWVSWFTNRIKAITGKVNWYDTPDTTLAAAKTHIDSAAPHAGHETPAGAQAKVTAHEGAANPHPGYIPKSLATATDQVMVSTGVGAWAVKTLAQFKSWLGLGDAAYKNTGTAAGTVAAGDHAHNTYVPHSLATAANDFLVASGAGAFVKKTLAEVKAILGLGTAAYTASTAYATAAQGTLADNALPKAGGTLTGAVVAHTGTDYTTKRVRNIYCGTADLTPGVSPLDNGTIYVMYE